MTENIQEHVHHRQKDKTGLIPGEISRLVIHLESKSHG